MSRVRQIWLITLLAGLGFLGLRSLPDTHCAFLHNDHQPVVADGLEFCGVNEEANYYSPKAMRYPVRMDLTMGPDGKGSIRLLGDEGRPMLAHEMAVSHTRLVHLHLRQNTGRSGYVHIHPVPSDEGRWDFELPADFLVGNPGGDFQAFADFVPVRNRRVMLAEADFSQKLTGDRAAGEESRIRLVSCEQSTTKAGQSAVLRLRLSGPDGAPLRLRPLMGSLGHAVLFGDRFTNPGYAHMHPSLEGGEYDQYPTLSFRIRLPKPGDYDFWLHVSDGSDQYLRHRVKVTP